MDFPTDKQYLDMVDELQKIPGLRLCNGNCGAFAMALKSLFGQGTIMAIWSGTGFPHVLLEYNGKYYDGETIYKSYDALKESRWGSHIEDEYDFVDVEKKFNVKTEEQMCILMEEMTLYYMESSRFVPLIKSNTRAVMEPC